MMELGRRMRSQLSLLYWTLIAVGGCAPVQAYPGAARPAGEVAVLVQGITGMVRAVDGREVEPSFNDYVAVLPGERKLTVRAAWRNSFAERVDLTFMAVAGRKYWVSHYHEADWTDDVSLLGPR